MSYRRSFTKRIAIHYSGSVHYPPSENGGSVSYSGTEYEDVVVNIDVDTESFDNSVHHCNNSIGLLTGAVVATEGAQVVSIKNNALKVGKTIIDGFFKTVRYEISQQIVELSNKIDATLLHLHELAKRCVDKQHQMEIDYNRISGRYLKIFDELNNELKNRIYEVDRPVFIFKQENDKSSYRAIGNDLVGTVVVSGKENGQLEAKIEASIIKKRTLDTIEQANCFLEKQKQTNNILHHCILNDNHAATYYVPVGFIETNGNDHQIYRRVYQTEAMNQMNNNELIDDFNKMQGKNASDQDINQIKLHFNTEVSTHYASSNSHDNRVKDYITRLFNFNTIQKV